MHEINPSSEVLNQLRPYWGEIITLIMLKSNIKEITLDSEDFALLMPPHNKFVACLGRKHLGPDKGFTLVVTNSQAELVEVLARHKCPNPS